MFPEKLINKKIDEKKSNEKMFSKCIKGKELTLQTIHIMFTNSLDSDGCFVELLLAFLLNIKLLQEHNKTIIIHY